VCCLRTLRSYSQWSAMQWSGRHASELLHLVLDRLLELQCSIECHCGSQAGQGVVAASARRASKGGAC
jgi:hypothetical protein